MANQLLFCNIGWMKDYQGQTSNDKIIGGGRYVKVEKRGHEVCNFVSSDGLVYGYVQPVGSRIVVQKLGAPKNADFIEGIDVIVTARRPGGDTVIAGWFKNATVHEWIQDIDNPSRLHKANGIDCYRYKANQKDVTLLPPEERTFIVPRGKGGIGQSNVWYAENASPSWLADVRRLIDRGLMPIARKGGRRAKPDHFRNALVENAAMAYVWNHYSSQGYALEDVSKKNLGWDLEATSGKLKLRIEVKGLSGTTANAELTPNEYKAFMQCSYSYRLCIVTDALATPSLSICHFNLASEQWIVEGNSKCSKMKFTERVAASITLV